jgi:hypothetical protein
MSMGGYVKMGPDGEGVDQIQLTQDRMQWQDFVNFLAS